MRARAVIAARAAGDTDANSLSLVSAAVPEPGTLALAGVGLALAAWGLRRRRPR